MIINYGDRLKGITVHWTGTRKSELSRRKLDGWQP